MADGNTLHSDPAAVPTPDGGTQPPWLDIRDVSLKLGGLHVLTEVSLTVEPNAIVGLVGPNGAGKTSLFNCICGYYRPSAGAIFVSDTDVTHRRPYQLCRLGVARTFQHPLIQGELSVLENVLAGGHTRTKSGPVSYALQLPAARRAEREIYTRARELLDYLQIGAHSERMAGSLSYGQQKRVELARALLTEPRLLLLDELASGLTQEEVMHLARMIQQVRSDLDVAVLLVEHHMGMVAAITDKIVVLAEGTKLIEGDADSVQSDPEVIEAYLGVAS